MYGPHTPHSPLSSCSRPLKITLDVDLNSSTSSMLFSSFILILLFQNLSSLERKARSLPEVIQMFHSHSLTLSLQLLLTFSSLLSHRPLAHIEADSLSQWRSKKALLPGSWSYIRLWLSLPSWRQLLKCQRQAERWGGNKHRDGISPGCLSCVCGHVVSFTGFFSTCKCLFLWNGAYVLSPVWSLTDTQTHKQLILPPYVFLFTLTIV